MMDGKSSSKGSESKLERHAFAWPIYADNERYASVRSKMLCQKCGKYPHEHGKAEIGVKS